MSEVTADSLLITRGRGRPRVEQRKVPLTTNVPPAYYDRIAKLAHAQGEHLSVVVCKLLEDALKHMR